MFAWRVLGWERSISYDLKGFDSSVYVFDFLCRIFYPGDALYVVIFLGGGSFMKCFEFASDV